MRLTAARLAILGLARGVRGGRGDAAAAAEERPRRRRLRRRRRRQARDRAGERRDLRLPRRRRPGRAAPGRGLHPRLGPAEPPGLWRLDRAPRPQGQSGAVPEIPGGEPHPSGRRLGECRGPRQGRPRGARRRRRRETRSAQGRGRRPPRGSGRRDEPCRDREGEGPAAAGPAFRPDARRHRVRPEIRAASCSPTSRTSIARP